MFWKTVNWKYDAVDFDDEWKDLVDSIVKGELTDKPARSSEKRYDNRYLVSAAHELHAERVIENLQAKYPQLQFAAHTNFNDRKWWHILVRTKSERAPSAKERKNLRSAAKAILRNVEAKYPQGKPQKKTGFWGSLFG